MYFKLSRCYLERDTKIAKKRSLELYFLIKSKKYKIKNNVKIILTFKMPFGIAMSFKG